MFQSYKVAKLRKKCEPGIHPDFLLNYLSSYEHKPRLQTQIADLRFVVFDTETTGLEIGKDSILSIGSAVIEKESILARNALNLLIDNEHASQEAISIHGITPGESSDGLSEAEAVGHFLQQLGPSVIVAHHAGFDTGMIEHSIRKLFLPRFFLFNPVLDTVFLTKKLAKRDESMRSFQNSRISLDKLSDHFGIPTHDRHTAWGDAFITAQLLLILLKRLYRSGSRTLGDLLKE